MGLRNACAAPGGHGVGERIADRALDGRRLTSGSGKRCVTTSGDTMELDPATLDETSI
jgi:hypothetical protein